jgi:hypothetical protein
MRMRNLRYEVTSEITSKPLQCELAPQKTEGHPRSKASMEKKIERILSDSKKLGWSYNEFVGYLLEVLIVLQQRNNLDLRSAPDLTAHNSQLVCPSPVQQTSR